MSKMEEVLPEEEAKIVSQTATQAHSKNSADMYKAINKRLKLSQKVTDSISAYCNDPVALEGIPGLSFITLYALLDGEQSDLKKQIASMF